MAKKNKTEEAPRIVVVLAGGEGRRMGGADKGALSLSGKRMIDHVLERLSPQTDQILISGDNDYGTGLTTIPDRKDGPKGPAAGLWSALCWIYDNAPDAKGFMTAPADGPFLPADLFDQLEGKSSAIVKTEDGTHPTFAWWRLKDLKGALTKAVREEGVSLKELAADIDARRVKFDDADAFFNVNTPKDLEKAEARLRG